MIEVVLMIIVIIQLLDEIDAALEQAYLMRTCRMGRPNVKSV